MTATPLDERLQNRRFHDLALPQRILREPAPQRARQDFADQAHVGEQIVESSSSPTEPNVSAPSTCPSPMSGIDAPVVNREEASCKFGVDVLVVAHEHGLLRLQAVLRP